jgi:BASS family bile acid:Na+ symporter
MELLQAILPHALRASLILLVLAVGLDAVASETTYVLRRPQLAARSLCAIALVVPALSAFVVSLLPLERVVKIAIILMSVSPMPPFMPSKEMKLGGRREYVYGLLVAVSLFSIILVPVTVAILSRAFGEHASIAPGTVLRLILISIIAPLAAGVLVRRTFPEGAKRAAPIVNKIAMVLLAIAILPLVVALAPAMWRLIGNGTVLAIALIVALALLAGHLLGGREPHDRATLAIACTTRHPGVALLIAQGNFPEPDIKAAILLFMIIGLLVGLPYQVLQKRQLVALR